MKPFIKWAGGKRWLAESAAFRIPHFDGRYIEPFLGGGAVFFDLLPQKALLSDLNPKLIEVYQAVCDDWVKVDAELRRLQRLHSKEFYYEERGRKRLTPHTRAAQFLYLNRTCWNGLYRENTRGEFNVPIGTKTKVIFDGEDFESISAILKNAELMACDFEETVRRARMGDLIFADPPYTVAHNLNGFVKYNQNIFSWEDQVRLRDCLVSAASRGAKVVVTNADHHTVRELYRETASYHSVERHSVIAGASRDRRPTSEAIFTIG